VDLAVALAHGPALVFLDEPSSGLDQMYSKALLKILREVPRRNGTLVIATHDAAELGIADWVLWLENGRIRSHGRLDLLLEREVGGFAVSIEAESAKRAMEVATSLQEVAVTVNPQGTAVTAYGAQSLKDWALVNARLVNPDAITVRRTGPIDLLGPLRGDGGNG